MLASPGPLPTGGGVSDSWAYEVKWDGMRVLATRTPQGLVLTSRTDRDVTARFPEVAAAAGGAAWDAVPPGTVLDGEVVALDDAGLPSFARLAPRIQGDHGAGVPVTYLVFDLIVLGPEEQVSRTYDDRRALLLDTVPPGKVVQVPEAFDDGEALLAATAARGLEGVVAKRRASPYRPGVRSPDWVKVPHRTTASYVIGGWKAGAAGAGHLGSVLVGTPTGDGRLLYEGAVGSGIGGREETALLGVLAGTVLGSAPFHASEALPDKDITWVEPILVVDVAHLGRGGQGLLRQPAVVRLRPDLAVSDLQNGTGP
jgi:bifunctional non-homologous end joining protein LigD